MTSTHDDAAPWQALVAELAAVRAKGLLRLRELDLPALYAAAARHAAGGEGGAAEAGAAPGAARAAEAGAPGTPGAARAAEAGAPGTPGAPRREAGPVAVEGLLRRAAQSLEGERLRPAALHTFGLGPDTRDLSAKLRRERAADVFGVGAERFRKHQEKLVLREMATAVLALPPGARDRTPPAVPGAPRIPTPAAGAAGAAHAGPPDGTAPAPASQLGAGRTVVPVAFPHGTVRITLHVSSIELLSGVDVLVSSENTYFEMSKTFRSTVSGSVRRAGARKDAAGRILDDLIARQLTAWVERFGSPGLPVAPGTVVATSPGELAARGVRRIYHAAIAAPLPGTDRYETPPWVVAAAVRRVFEQAREERRTGGVPLRSIALPLLGAGRGGLDPRTSLETMLAAMAPALATDPGWAVHLAIRDADVAAAVLDTLTGHRPDAALPRG
ncbi:hypothetical protein [Actinacidiphila sp. ITFR-21]|uniref:hypothetical protein n=1 Tax=Actinacidiphila sp. ITFR-21 TaxID=3075199 RepID=UPI00288B80E1|nr:hypothetical protein [Streptomyces sp. ITFR-21]WNI16101.1 hypothetical protein RLT57_11550 [Streptomyces sp. ITFR-21]